MAVNSLHIVSILKRIEALKKEELQIHNSLKVITLKDRYFDAMAELEKVQFVLHTLRVKLREMKAEYARNCEIWSKQVLERNADNDHTRGKHG